MVTHIYYWCRCKILYLLGENDLAISKLKNKSKTLPFKLIVLLLGYILICTKIYLQRYSSQPGITSKFYIRRMTR